MIGIYDNHLAIMALMLSLGIIFAFGFTTARSSILWYKLMDQWLERCSQKLKEESYFRPTLFEIVHRTEELRTMLTGWALQKRLLPMRTRRFKNNHLAFKAMLKRLDQRLRYVYILHPIKHIFCSRASWVTRITIVLFWSAIMYMVVLATVHIEIPIWLKMGGAFVSYYGSTESGASDSNDGLSAEYPKLTMSAIRAMPTTAGDVLYLERGSDWGADTDVTYIGVTGTSGSPIIVDAFGSGSKPNLRQITSLRDYHHYKNVQFGDNASYYYNGIVVLFDSGQSHDGCLVEGVDIVGGNTSTSAIAIMGNGDGCEFYNNTMSGCTGSGVVVYGNATDPVSDLVVRSCTGTGIGSGNGDGVTLHRTDSGDYELGAGFTLYDLEFNEYGEDSYDLTSGSEILLIRSKGRYSAGTIIHTDHGLWDMHICYCEFLNSATGSASCILISTPDVYIYNCLIVNENSCYSAIAYTWATHVNSHSNPQNIWVIYNTIIDNSAQRGTINVTEDATGFGNSTTDTIKFKNNIVSIDSSNMTGSIWNFIGPQTTGAGNAAWDVDYNTFWQGSTAVNFYSGGNYTLGTWRSTFSHDANSIEGDPDLVDETGGTYAWGSTWHQNYQLQPTSPCIEKATPVSTGSFYPQDATDESTGATLSGISQDYFGYTRDLTTPDMGAFEYGALAPDPPVMTTNAGTNVDVTTFTANANITDVGSGSVVTRGFEYNTSETDVGASTEFENGSFSTGAYSLSITGLTGGNNYYYRAYAINGTDKGYGSWVLVTTIATDVVTIENGDIVYLEEDDEMICDVIIDTGGQLRQNGDGTNVTLTGAVVLNGGTIGHSGCVGSNFTVTGGVTGTGTNYLLSSPSNIGVIKYDKYQESPPIDIHPTVTMDRPEHDINNIQE